jgi:hypothetical protein
MVRRNVSGEPDKHGSALLAGLVGQETKACA